MIYADFRNRFNSEGLKIGMNSQVEVMNCIYIMY